MTTIEQFDVQVAMPDDKAALLAFAIMIKTEDALQEVSNEKVEAMVDRCIQRDRAIAGIIRGPMGIEASIGLMVEELDYSDDMHLQMKWVGTHAACRKSGHGPRLMGFAQHFQEKVGIPLFMSVLTATGLDGKLRMFARHAPQVGAIFSLGAVPKGAYNQKRPNMSALDETWVEKKAEAFAQYVHAHPDDHRFDHLRSPPRRLSAAR